MIMEIEKMKKNEREREGYISEVKGDGCDNERGDSSGGSDFGVDHNRDSV